MFLRAKLIDGTQVISEFTKLGRTERYVNQVFTGQKPFNAWRIVGRAHPVSGEAVVLRTRLMLNGSQVVAVEQVVPTIEDHNYDPANFKSAETVQKGSQGIYTVPEQDVPEPLAGVAPGTQYPIHRDDGSFRKFIVTRVANPEAEAGSAESIDQRFYLDGQGERAPATAYASRDTEDDGDDWEDDDDGDEDFR